MNPRDVDPAVPALPPVGQVTPNDWFKRFPNGGTVYQQPDAQPRRPSHLGLVDWFRRMPNGGGTVYVRAGESRPYDEVGVYQLDGEEDDVMQRSGGGENGDK